MNASILANSKKLELITGESHYQRFAKKRRKKLRIWLTEYKEGIGCMQCGEKRSPALDFHHRNPETKEFNVSQGPRYGYSKDRIIAEIAKCDLLCANCHRCLDYTEEDFTG